MTDLTEQLENGSYYIKDTNGNIYIDDYYKEIGEFTFAGTRLKEVLAPVPSYEEWQETLQALDAAHKAIKMEDETINRLVCSCKQCNYEKRKLKELLKECQSKLNYCTRETYELQTKINQALGE